MPAFPRLPQSSPFTRVPLFWQLQLAGWGAFGLLVLPLKQVVYGSMQAGLLITAYQLPLSLALTCLLRYYYQRTAPSSRLGWQAIGLVLAGCATASAVDVLISIPVNHYFGLFGPVDILAPSLYFFRTTIYLGWSLLYFLLKAQVAARQHAFQAAVSEEKLRLETVRYQFNPQFLTGSLAAISDEIDQDPAIARAMTMRLTNFYRQTLRQVERNATATLGEELELLRAYLEIERLRRGDTLIAQFNVDDSLLAVPLPPLLLLPLVKKAVKYGFATSHGRLEIRISAQRTAAGELLLEVTRTGRLMESSEPGEAAGTDLLNLHARLERHYPGRHHFVMTQDSTRVRASLSLPVDA